MPLPCTIGTSLSLLNAPRSAMAAFVDTFGRADGAIDNNWFGATWTISNNLALNTPSLGANLMTNPGFDSDTGWTKGTNWAISAGVATHTGGSGSIDIISQSKLTSGGWYRTDWTITTFNAGLFFALYGTNGNLSSSRNAVGTYVNMWRADGATAAIRCNLTGDGSVDNVTFKLLALADLFATRNMQSAYGAMNAIWDAYTGAQCGVVMCLDNPANPQNFVLAYLDGNNYIRLDKCVGGVYTNLIAVNNSATTPVVGRNLRLYRVPGTNTWQVWYGLVGNETQIGTDQTITDANIVNNTYAGLFATSSDPRCRAVAWNMYPIPPWVRIGDVVTATVAGDQSNCYEPNVLYESGAQILSGTVYKMWYTSGWANANLNYAESVDGITWTKYGSNPIIANHFRSTIIKSGSTYYLYATTTNNIQIDLYTSSDGVSWSLDTASVIARGSGGAWDDNAVANSIVWLESTNDWRMLYEAKRSTTGWKIGYATSTDGRSWSKSGSNPVIDGTGSRGGPWVKKIDSTYHLWGHYAVGTGSEGLPTDIYHWTSSDLVTWTLAKPWSMLPRLEAAEGTHTSVGQCADPFILERNETMYLFYSGSADGSQQSGQQRIRLVIAPVAYIGSF